MTSTVGHRPALVTLATLSGPPPGVSQLTEASETEKGGNLEARGGKRAAARTLFVLHALSRLGNRHPDLPKPQQLAQQGSSTTHSPAPQGLARKHHSTFVRSSCSSLCTAPAPWRPPANAPFPSAEARRKRQGGSRRNCVELLPPLSPDPNIGMLLHVLSTPSTFVLEEQEHALILTLAPNNVVLADFLPAVDYTRLINAELDGTKPAEFVIEGCLGLVELAESALSCFLPGPGLEES